MYILNLVYNIVIYNEFSHCLLKSFLPATQPGMQCACVSVSVPVYIGVLPLYDKIGARSFHFFKTVSISLLIEENDIFFEIHSVTQ